MGPMESMSSNQFPFKPTFFLEELSQEEQLGPWKFGPTLQITPLVPGIYAFFKGN